MSPQELAFILKMHDEATATLKKIGSALRGMGGEAGEARDDTEKLGDSLDRLKRTAAEVTVAVGGIWASMKGIREANRAWGQYELGLVGVQKTTNMTQAEMDDFARSFDVINARMNGIDTRELLGIAEAAGQMGQRGKANLLAFTEVMGKLGVTTDIVGQDGTLAIGRVLKLTGSEGPEAVRRFGDSLNWLGNNSAATESEILSMTNMIAQSTAGMNLSTDAVLALAAASKEVGLRDELTGSAFGRTLRNLRDGAANATNGFKTFLQVTGMTKEQFDELARQHPEQILLRFAEAYAALQPTGKSAGFLDQLGLNTDEIKRVFGTMGSKVDEFQAKLAALQSGQQEGALDQEAEKFFGANANQIEGMLKAWDQVKAAVGEALAPLTGPAIEMAASFLNSMAQDIRAMPGPMKTFLAAAILLAPAIIGAVKAMALLRVAFAALGGRGGLAAKLLGGQAAMAAAGDTLGAVAGTAAGTRFGKTMTRILKGLKLAVKVGIYFELAKAAGEGIAGLINRYAPNAANRFADWRDDPNNPVGRAIIGAGNFIGVKTPRQQAEEARAQMEESQAAVAQARQQALAQGQQTGEINTDVDIPNPNTAGSKSIDDIVKGLRDQIADARALTGVARERVELERTIREVAEETGVSYDEARRQVSGLVGELQRARAAAAVIDVLRGYDEQINAARAVTGEEKLQADIQKQINDLEREYGNITNANRQAIADKAQAAFDAQRQVAYAELIRDTTQQLIALTAITAEEKAQAEVVKTILDFERERGRLSDQDREVLATRLMQLRQIAEFQRLADQYDPVGTARRRYEEELRTLEVMRQQNVITAEVYQRMRQNLDEMTRAQRDPVGERTRALREELSVLRQAVDQQSIEWQVLQDVNSLRQQGIVVTQGMTDAIREYALAMEDYRRASTEGIGGWISEVGPLRENMMGLTKDFASGLSGAISGALAGDSNAFRNFAQQLGRKMIETGVNQLMAQAFKGLGFQDPQQKALDRADEALKKLDALNQAGINTPQAIVNAGMVNINSQALDQVLRAANDNLNTLGTQTGGVVPGSANDNTISGLFTGSGGKTLQLSAQDIIDLKKTVATEWVRSAGDLQGKGIIDTILNRQASGKWGSTVADVVNARSQFSDINGPVAWRQGRNSVSDLPMSRISPEVDRLVDQYLAERASGAQSAVGDNLNYANPNYSDRRNLGWINNLRGPVLGRGDAIHRHGTTPDLQQYRPGDFGVTLPGQQQLQQATAQVQQATQQMTTAIQPMAQQVQQAGMAVQLAGPQMQMGSTQAMTAMQQLNTAQQQTGQAATTTGQQFQQAGQQIAAAGTQASTAAGSGGGAGFAGLASQIASATGGGADGAGAAGSMGSILNSMLPMLMQFLPPPFNLLGGLFSSVFGGLFADGGKIKGPGTGTSDSILAAVSNGEFIVNARSTKEWGPMLQAINDNTMPRFRDGGMVGGNVVSIGERAMVSGRRQAGTAEVAALADQVSDLSKVVGKVAANGRSRVNNNAVNMTVNARDADSFRRSEGQLLADASLKLNRLGARNN